MIVAWLTDALVILGVLVMTIGVYAVYRMPDVYTQLHGASKAVFLGVVALLVASAATADLAIVTRAFLIAVFLVLTTPVAAHVIARAAYVREEAMETPGALDESRERSAATAHTTRSNVSTRRVTGSEEGR